MKEISPERRLFLNSVKKHKRTVFILQAPVLVGFVVLWELLCYIGILDPFITSCPSRIALCIIRLIKEGSLFIHLGTSCLETAAGFILGTIIGAVIAIILWWSDLVSAVLEPYLVVLNALPKVALGPIIIVWAGAGTGSIIIMTLAISLIVTVLEVLNSFHSTDPQKIILLRSMGAKKHQIFIKAVFPENLRSIVSSLKVNVGLSWVGVIMGEFLVSKAGLGYLITYGSQVFQMDLVMTSVILLALAATLMYKLITLLEKLILNKAKL